LAAAAATPAGPLSQPLVAIAAPCQLFNTSNRTYSENACKCEAKQLQHTIACNTAAATHSRQHAACAATATSKSAARMHLCRIAVGWPNR
jgi:hypothetical protein